MAVAITPGWLRSEMMLDNLGVSEENWRDAIIRKRARLSWARPEFALSESPQLRWLQDRCPGDRSAAAMNQISDIRPTGVRI